MKMGVIITLLASLLLLPAIAGAETTEGWKFRITPYIWGAGTSGDITTNGEVSDFDSSFGDVLKNLTMGAMARGVATNGPWGIFIDGLWINLKDLSETPNGDLTARIRMGFVTLGGAYRLAEIPLGNSEDTSVLSFEVNVGGRYTIMWSELEPQWQPNVTSDSDWIDPVIGGRIIARLPAGFSIFTRGDIGGFGIGSASDLTWNLEGGLDYRVSELISIAAEYRCLSIKRYQGNGTDRNGINMKLMGPAVGVSFIF